MLDNIWVCSNPVDSKKFIYNKVVYKLCRERIRNLLHLLLSWTSFYPEDLPYVSGHNSVYGKWLNSLPPYKIPWCTLVPVQSVWLPIILILFPVLPSHSFENLSGIWRGDGCQPDHIPTWLSLHWERYHPRGRRKLATVRRYFFPADHNSSLTSFLSTTRLVKADVSFEMYSAGLFSCLVCGRATPMSLTCSPLLKTRVLPFTISVQVSPWALVRDTDRKGRDVRRSRMLSRLIFCEFMCFLYHIPVQG